MPIFHPHNNFYNTGYMTTVPFDVLDSSCTHRKGGLFFWYGSARVWGACIMKGLATMAEVFKWFAHAATDGSVVVLSSEDLQHLL